MILRRLAATGAALLITAVAFACGGARPQANVLVPMMDSSSAVVGATAAIMRYELTAHHYWSPRAAECDDRRGCAICVAVPGRAPCVLGRFLPCDAGSRRNGRWLWHTECVDHHRSHPGLGAVDSVSVWASLDTLRTVLREAGAIVRNDPFIVGQQVFYALLARKPDSALHIARECAAERSWCWRLQGLAALRGGQTSLSDSLLAQASANMPSVQRCKWEDVSLLLTDSADVRSYLSHSCGTPQREAFERRFWAYADPAWLIAGNDRRTEHLARGIELTLQDAILAAGCDSLSFACIRRRGELVNPERDLIRYGARDSWRRQRSRDSLTRVAGRVVNVACGGSRAQPYTGSGFDRFSIVDRYHFVPDVVGDTQTPARWNVNAGPEVGVAGLLPPTSCDPRPSLPERYAPPYASMIEGLSESQTGVFRNPDGSLAVAVAASSRVLAELLTRSPSLVGSWQAKGFAFATDQLSDGLVEHGRGVDASIDKSGRVGALVSIPEVRGGHLAVGLEALLPRAVASRLGAGAIADAGFAGTTLMGASPENGVLVRFRGFVPGLPGDSQRVRISDAILVAATDASAPTSLASAATTMLPSSHVAGDRVALYWELYGLRPSDTVGYSLRIIPQRIARGTWESVWRKLRFAPDDAPVLMRWRGSPLAGVGRSTILGLAAIPDGQYILELSATIPGQAPLTVLRALELRR